MKAPEASEVASWEAALALALRGDARAAQQALRDLDPRAGAVAAAWSLHLRATVAQLGGDSHPPPSPREARQCARDEAARPVVLAICASEQLRAWVYGRHDAFDEWADVAAKCGDGATEDQVLTARLIRLRSYVACRDGQACSRAQALAARAAGQSAAAVAVEATTLRAWALIDADDVTEGLRIARRASRMARVEGLVVQEYLANLTLARARRVAGRPHLSLRILHALALVCPPGWRGRLAWEMALAGGVEDARRALAPADGTPAVRAARPMVALVAAAEGGGERAASTHATELAEACAPWPSLRAEADDVCAALDPRKDLAGRDPRLAAWVSGATRRSPPALRGLSIPRGGRAGALVLLTPGGGARRLLPAARGLLPASARAFLVALNDAHERSMAMLVALGFAGSAGLDLDLVAREVFGLRRDPVRHDQLLRTTLYRARNSLGDSGEIRRHGERLILELRHPIAVPDPSCAPDLEEMLLRAIAVLGGRATARELSDHLALQLRSVQSALRRLVDEEACFVERDGRRVSYCVEDTTFSDPTVERLTPRANEG